MFDCGMKGSVLRPPQTAEKELLKAELSEKEGRNRDNQGAPPFDFHREVIRKYSIF